MSVVTTPEIAEFGERVCKALSFEEIHRIALPEIARFVDGDSGALHLFDHRHRATLASTFGASLVLLYEFEEMDRNRCEHLQRSLDLQFPVHDAMLHPSPRSFRASFQGELLWGHGMEHCMLIPLIQRGRAVGTITMARREGSTPFTVEDQRIADRLGKFVLVAHRNAALYESVAGIEAEATPQARLGAGVINVRMQDESRTTLRASHQVTSQLTDSTLSPREIEIFELVAGGLTNVELARELNISVNTVKSHVKQIYRKLGVRSRIEMVHKVYDPAD